MVESASPAPLPRKDFSDYEDKTDEALSSFVNLDECIYKNKYIGSSRNDELMECDCFENYKEEDGINHACDEDTDCINRLTLIECTNGLCSYCGDDCQNQRFQKQEYADIAVFRTEKKGYGVRAEANISANQFIYEYKGEVIEEEEFRDRLIDYDEKKFKHFYFMMLQTGEFIDATLKGSLARFCNHSCNPNAYVNKWVVAGRLRMGIFAKRKIFKGEEITFDYNVDRYGATAQKCYCDEPNCIGFLGGKTQTDAASLLPQIYADALGISSSAEKKWIKWKKSQGEKMVNNDSNNINEEFVSSVTVEACEDNAEIRKVMSALLQTDNALIAEKLLNRIFPCDDENLLYQIVKLHGYSCFGKIIDLFKDKEDILHDIIIFLEKLPKTTKNGIETARLDTKIMEIQKSSSYLTEVAGKLLEKWSTYETYKRISKKEIKTSNSHKRQMDMKKIRLPPGWEIIHENGKQIYFNAQRQLKLHYPPGGSTSGSSNSPNYRDSHNLSRSSSGLNLKRNNLELDPEERKKRRLAKEQEALERAKQESLRQREAKMKEESEKKTVLQEIIAEANRQKEQEREEALRISIEKEAKKQHWKSTSQEKKLEHKWNKYFASVVPNILHRYESEHKLKHEHIKECARDIVKILSQKELKKHANKLPPDEMTSEKKVKVRSFTKAYMDKFIVKYNQKKQNKS